MNIHHERAKELQKFARDQGWPPYTPKQLARIIERQDNFRAALIRLGPTFTRRQE